jgi:hypothetical protein
MRVCVCICKYVYIYTFFFHGATLRITLRHNTLGRTPLEEWSARHRDLYLTTHNTNNRLKSMPLAEFEPIIPARQRPQVYALACAATGIANSYIRKKNMDLELSANLQLSIRSLRVLLPLHTKICRHFSFLPHALHVPPISASFIW